MKKNVLNTDLSGKVAVVTGAGGVLCSVMAKDLARAGAKVALLNRTFEKAKAVEEAILAEGGIATSPQIMRPWSGRIGPSKPMSYNALTISYISKVPSLERCAASSKLVGEWKYRFLTWAK